MDPRHISIEQYDYPLPDALIAKHPLARRDACKLLVRTADGRLSTHVFSELPSLLPPDALLVCNNTRVINARMRFRKPTGALIEIFCLEPASPADYERSFASVSGCEWLCLVGNSKRWKEGAIEGVVVIDGRPVGLRATRVSASAGGSVIRFDWDGESTFSEIIRAAGEIPIPPYLNRSTEASDADDYQTVYSRIEGSVAAPTAGLHFTPEVLSGIDDRGVERLEVTLHVGAGTFQPVKSNEIGEHDMHSEFIAVPRDVIERLAESGKRPVFAVGTTSVRTLESLYHIGCLMYQGCWAGEVPQWYPYDSNHPRLTAREALSYVVKALDSNQMPTLIASTRVIIAPGYQYRVVDGMVTNFHQPKSTLLLLVSAFIGKSWRDMYDYALAGGYRFLSYGDACLLCKKNN